MQVKAAFGLVKQTVSDWSEDKAPRLGAALAYYSVFSIGPLVIFTISLAGLLFGREAAEGQIIGTMQGLVGAKGADAIRTMILNARHTGTGWLATIFSLAMLIAGASGVFGQLKDALDTVWNVERKPNLGIMGTVKRQFFSVTAVLGTAFLLLVSLVLNAGLSALSNAMAAALPGGTMLWQGVNLVISFAVIAGIFALMFKYVPDAKIAWGDVWIGALLTAALFVVGKFVIGLYLGHSNLGSSYGAASSLVLVMIWVYYSAQILFFGAEFTQVWANTYGSRIVPAPDAIPLTDTARAEQGIPSHEAKHAAAATGGSAEHPLQPAIAEAKPGKKAAHLTPEQEIKEQVQRLKVRWLEVQSHLKR